MNFNRLREIDNDYQFTYQTKVYNNGDFNYRVFINIVDYNKAAGVNGFFVNVCIAKTVRSLKASQVKDILKCFGIDNKSNLSDFDVFDYGYNACITKHPSRVETIQEAKNIANSFKENIDIYTRLIGFYLDRPQNMIGDTGWDFLDGNIGLFHHA